MPIDSRYIFRIPSPSNFISPDDKIERLTKDINRVLEEIGTSLKNTTGASGQTISFDADLNLKGHRILALGDPREDTTAAHKKYVDEKIDELQELIDEINHTIHNELPAGGQAIVLTRVLPTTVNDIIEIGSFMVDASAHAFDIAITVSSGGFSLAKAYTLVTNFSINTDWQMALPLVDTGPYSAQDYALDVKQVDADNKLYLRLRRSLGTTAGTATIQIRPRGLSADLFQESSTTASVAAPTVILESAVLTVRDGDIGVNTALPNRGANGTALTVRGNDGTNPANLELENPATGANAVMGRVRYWNGAVEMVRMEAQTGATDDIGRWYLHTTPAGGAIEIAIVVTGAKNVVVGGGTAAGSSAEKVVVIGTGVAPGSSPANSVQLYSIDAAAGNACLGIRTEAGNLLKLFTGAALTAASGGALSSGGAAVLSTADANILNNALTRIAELEARLQASGQIA